MPPKTVIMIGLAIVFGVAGVFTAQRWLDRQSSLRMQTLQVVEKPVATRTLVVAAAPLRFGVEIGRQHLREIAWPEGAIPNGAFGSITEVLDGKAKRIALTAVEENEPLLKTKMTGPGQRASLAAVIEPGMKAMTVRVNDVNGVAGFVLPGERVDVLLTRNVDQTQAYADVLLQNVKVLAADQSADERSDKPSLAKAVTLEVSTPQTQKLTLASTVGSLSLVLRAAGVVDVEATQRIGITDLSREEPAVTLPTPASAPVAEPRRTATVTVARALTRQEYSVPAQGRETPVKMQAIESTAKLSQRF